MSLLGLGPRSAQPNKLGSIQVSTSEYGTVLTVACGSNRIPMKLLDYIDFVVGKPMKVGGKGFGGNTKAYEYYAAVMAFLCDGHIDGLGDTFDSSGTSALMRGQENYSVTGGAHQVANGGSIFYYDEGVRGAVNFSVVASDYGSDGTITYSGTHGIPFAKVAGTPGAHEYRVDATGNYYFSLADAGMVVTINYAYTRKDSNTIYQSPQQRLHLTLFNGSRPQAPWGYMQARHPERALSYPGISYIADASMDLGASATVPNYRFEVLNASGLALGGGFADCDPSAVLKYILTDPFIGSAWLTAWCGDWSQASKYCVANSLLISPVWDSTQQMSQVIKDVLTWANAEAFWSEKKLKVVPYGDTTVVGNGVTFTPQTQPIYDLTDEDFLDSGSKGEDPLQFDWQDLTDNYNRVWVEFADRSMSYNTNKVDAANDQSIALIGRRPAKTIAAPAITEIATAQFLSQAICQRLALPMRKWKFTLGWWAAQLEPMDIVTVPNISRTAKLPVRIIKIDETETGDLAYEALDFAWGTGQATLYNVQAGVPVSPTGGAFPGDVVFPVIFEPNDRLSALGSYELWMGLSSSNPNWGGCRIWLSTDGTNYQPIGTQSVAARQGWLTANVAAGTDPDTVRTFSVQLANPALQLLSGTTADANNFLTLCWIDGELVSFQTATLTGAGAYNLTGYLRRGIFGTPNSAHVGYAGVPPPVYGGAATFLRLDEAVFKYTYDPTLINKPLYFKFTSFNSFGLQEEGLADVAAVVFVPTGKYNNLGTAPLNSMVINSVVSGATATIQIYDITGGVGHAGTMTKDDGTVIVIPAASFVAEPFATYFLINWDPASSTYKLFSNAAAQRLNMSYGQVFIGALTTVNSDGSGGSAGGGGGGLPSGAVNVFVSPSYLATTAGGSIDFSANVTGTANTGVAWSVLTGGSGGTIDPLGTYTTPAGVAHGGDTILATSVANPGCQGSATASW